VEDGRGCIIEFSDQALALCERSVESGFEVRRIIDNELPVDFENMRRVFLVVSDIDADYGSNSAKAGQWWPTKQVLKVSAYAKLGFFLTIVGGLAIAPCWIGFAGTGNP
jgi:hypothetical protein